MNTALSIHGAPTHSANTPFLTYADGTPFFWLADTWWYCMTSRMSLPVCKKLALYRAKQGFTVIQCVIGVPPEIDWLDPQAGNSGGLPFFPDKTLNLRYFDEVDKKIHILIQAGLVPCIVGGWGHHIDSIGREPMQKLWQEIVRRYGHLPVVWCLTGEIDIIPPPGYAAGTTKNLLIAVLQKIPFSQKFIHIVKKILKTNHKQTLNRRLNAWETIAREIKKTQPKSRLLTVHVQGHHRASELFHTPDWLDIDSIQSSHAKESITFMREAIRAPRDRPMINMEPWYEGILGNFGPSDQRYAFWTSLLGGSAGHSYGAHGLWQMSTEANPFMTHWGKATWQNAYRQKGSDSIGHAKQFLVRFPWTKLVPCDDITPQSKPYQSGEPLCASWTDDHYIVYLPKQAKNTTVTVSRLSETKAYTVIEYSTKTLQALTTKHIQDANSWTIEAQINTDRLFVVQPRT